MMNEAQHGSNLEPVKKRAVMRTPDGRELPAGRQKGATSKVTRTIKEAIEMAAQGCHPRGLAGWLIDRANGGVQDRQIFAGMVSKALPLTVNANVNGGIRLELGWLSGRQVGPAAAQVQAKQPQVIDLQPEADGMYRIVDPAQQAEPVPAVGAAASEGLQGAADAGSTIPSGPTAPSA
jgi:hypothetical protein